MPYQKIPINALARPPNHQKEHAEAKKEDKQGVMGARQPI